MIVRSDVTALHDSATRDALRDTRWLDAIRRGDTDACHILFETYAPRLWQFAYAQLHSAPRAKEVVQRVFVSLWEQRTDLAVHGTPRAHLYGMLRQTALHQLELFPNAKDAASVSSGEPAELVAELGLSAQAEPMMESTIEAHVLAPAVARLLVRLPVTTRLALALRWTHQLSLGEIARVLEMSPEAAQHALDDAHAAMGGLLNALAPTRADAAETLDWEAIDRYFADQASEAESAAMRQWLTAHPAKHRVLMYVATELDGVAADVAFDVDSAWADARTRMFSPMLLRMHAEGEDSPSPRLKMVPDRRTPIAITPKRNTGQWIKPPEPPAPRGKTNGRLAAFTIIAAAAAIGLAFYLGPRFVHYIPAATKPAATPAEGRVVYTQPGQRLSVTLPDGSSAMVGMHSRLEYGPGFGERGRTLLLEGDGFFTVASHPGVPFIVKAGTIEVRALGTVFAVRRYPSDSSVRVTVVEGRVAVADTTLTAGDHATIAADGAVKILHGVDIATTLGWTIGQLTLDAMPLRDVIPELTRWYGVTVRVDDEGLLERPVRTVLHEGSATDALSLIAIMVRADMRQEGDTIILTRKRGRARPAASVAPSTVPPMLPPIAASAIE